MRPVEAVADVLQLLLAEARHVAGRHGAGVDPHLDGVVLAVDAEGVETHRLEHVEAAHGHIAPVDVGAGEGVHVADVQPFGGGVRKHHQVVVGPGRLPQVHMVDAALVPARAPSARDRSMVVADARPAHGAVPWSAGRAGAGDRRVRHGPGRPIDGAVLRPHGSAGADAIAACFLSGAGACARLRARPRRPLAGGCLLRSPSLGARAFRCGLVCCRHRHLLATHRAIVT